MLWKYQVALIIVGYGLNGYIFGTLEIPAQFVQRDSSQLVENSTFVLYRQQDKLLASWLLSTVSDEILSHLLGSSTTFVVWSSISCMFAARSQF